jgi:hypothetical protein
MLIEIIFSSSHNEILPKVGDGHFLLKSFQFVNSCFVLLDAQSRYAHSRKRSSVTN